VSQCPSLRVLSPRVGAPLLALALLLLSGAAPVLGSSHTRVAPGGVRVSVVPPAPAVIGTKVTVSAGAVDRAGRPIPNLRLTLYGGGRYLNGEVTDPRGRVTFRLSPQVTAQVGTLPLLVRFDGNRAYLPASTATRLEIRPATIEVVTVPVVSGVSITVGSTQRRTGPDGKVKIPVSRTGKYQLRPRFDLDATSDTRVAFQRWQDQQYKPDRTIDVKGDATYVLGLRVAHRGSLRFKDLDGRPVDPSQISYARLSASSSELVLRDFDDVWFEAATAVSRTGGLVESRLLWRLNEIVMAGTNVVNRGQQSWQPVPGESWTAELLLYDLSVTTEDALTGEPVSGTLELVYPDGSSRTLEMGQGAATRFTSLPRGTYTLKFHGAGHVPPTPVALSRSQPANLRVITTFDASVALGALLLVAAALVWIGRRHQLLSLAGAGRTRAGTAAGFAFRAVTSPVRSSVAFLAGVPRDIRVVFGDPLRGLAGLPARIVAAVLAPPVAALRLLAWGVAAVAHAVAAAVGLVVRGVVGLGVAIAAAVGLVIRGVAGLGDGIAAGFRAIRPGAELTQAFQAARSGTAVPDVLDRTAWSGDRVISPREFVSRLEGELLAAGVGPLSSAAPPNEPRERESVAGAESDEAKCPSCEGSVSRGARFCRTCGTRLQA
jgi:hypothetical protein